MTIKRPVDAGVDDTILGCGRKEDSSGHHAERGNAADSSRRAVKPTQAGHCAPHIDRSGRAGAQATMPPMRIGNFLIDPPVVLAPMAGVTDKPFRQLCKRLGAGLAVSEMTTADPRLWHTTKSQRRADHSGEPDPISVQIAGHDPRMLAEAARYNVDLGAQLIDINMGCPATD